MKIVRIFAMWILLVALLLTAVSCSDGTDGQETSATTTEQTTTATPPQSQSDQPSYLNPPLSRNFLFPDLNGDGTDEVVMHDLIDLFGGAGQYELKVYQKGQYSYDKIFDSETYLENKRTMDFTTAILRDGALEFVHTPTGYRAEYTVPEEDYRYVFKDAGTLFSGIDLYVDHFYDAKVTDSNNDGRDELVLYQYAWLGWHANGIGSCVTVFEEVDGTFCMTDIRLELDED